MTILEMQLGLRFEFLFKLTHGGFAMTAEGIQIVLSPFSNPACVSISSASDRLGKEYPNEYIRDRRLNGDR